MSVIQECKKLLLSNASLHPPAAALNKNEWVIRERFFSKTLNVIKDCNVNSYIAAAERINDSNIDVVNIQHEFGLYRGEFGSYILEFMRRVSARSFELQFPSP